MTIDGVDGSIVGDGDMTGGDPDEFAVLLVSFVDGLKPATLTGLQK